VLFRDNSRPFLDWLETTHNLDDQPVKAQRLRDLFMRWLVWHLPTLDQDFAEERKEIVGGARDGEVRWDNSSGGADTST
jgi:hypothetical protein